MEGNQENQTDHQIFSTHLGHHKEPGQEKMLKKLMPSPNTKNKSLIPIP
jgi:hypothetical protein